MIKLKNVSKYYYGKNVVTTGFSKINLELNINEFVAITGESGSGKSTLLNVISGMDSYEDGEMYIDGKETSHYTEQDYENYRRKYIGIIFQNFNLINSYTVYQNIELVLMLNGDKKKKEKILKLIEQVGLSKFKNTKVSKLSGGQKQRVAIARALAKDTPIIIADEPTGNLDSKSAGEVMKLLKEISKDKLVVVVTHNYEQLQEYATRRIKMHDGKIFEDVTLIKTNEETEKKQYKFGRISLIDKLKIGARNTFNIKTKFILLYLMFLFITGALLIVCVSDKKLQINNKIQGYNEMFIDYAYPRIIIKKKDSSEISKEEIEKVKKIKDVSKVVEDDFLIDSYIELSDGHNNWMNLFAKNLEDFNLELVHGKMPENDNEIILAGPVYEYYITEYEEVLNKEFYLVNEMTGGILNNYKYKIVGIAHTPENIYSYNFSVYVPNKVINDINYIFNQKNTNASFYFQDKYYQSSILESINKIAPSDRVAKGTVVIPEYYIYGCPYNNCTNKDFKLTLTNLFYEENINLKVANYFNNKNYNTLLGIINYEENSSNFYINKEDYDNLFRRRTYQNSVYVEDYEKIDGVVNELDKLGFKTLALKDSYSDFGDNEMMDIMMKALTIVLIVVLFFVSYFVIKIILKSRNVYYSTLRILGATKWISNQLLIIELLVLMNLGFFSIVGLVNISNAMYNPSGLFNILADMYEYADFKIYALLYFILFMMSLLISQKFAKSLFKKSALNTIREEV